MTADPTASTTGELGGVALMRLLQMVSPGLPIGAFAYSQGLEQAVADGWVTDEATASDWILGLLAESLASLDLPILFRLMAAWRAGDDRQIGLWSARLVASRPTREARAEDRQLGMALARTLATLEVDGAATLSAEAGAAASHAASFALAAVHFGIPDAAAAAGYAFSWAEALTSAAVRLVPLGQSAGQRLLAAVGDRVPAAVSRAAALGDDELGSAAPGQAIASARHETLYSRLFRS